MNTKIRQLPTSESQQLAAVTAKLRAANNTLAKSLGKRTSIPPIDISDAREQLKHQNDRLEACLKGVRTGEQP